MEDIRFIETVIGRSASLAIGAEHRANNSALRLYVVIAEQFMLGNVPTITVGTSSKIHFDGVKQFQAELVKGLDAADSFIGRSAFCKSVVRVLRIHEVCVAFGWDTVRFVSAYQSSPQKAAEALFGKAVPEVVEVVSVDAVEAEGHDVPETASKSLVEVAIGLFGQMNAEQLAECAVALASLSALAVAA